MIVVEGEQGDNEHNCKKNKDEYNNKNMKIVLIAIISIALLGSCRNQKSENFVGSTKTERENKTKPSLNFYIENGESMRGYFTNEKSALKTDLPKILSIGQHLTDFKLNYIRYGKVQNKCIIKNNVANGEADIIAKIDSLNNKSFDEDIQGGSGYKSMFETILNKLKKNEVVGLLSDFIPAGEFNDLGSNLNIFIKKTIIDTSFSIAVLKLESRFQGKYFRDKEQSNGFPLNQIRPYYIWFFGTKKDLEKLKILDYNFAKNNSLAGFIGVSIFSNQNNNIDYSILTNTFNNNTFSQNIDKSETHSCKNIVINKNVKKVKFGVAVNLSNIIIDKNYVIDTTNYEYSKKYYKLLGIFPIENDEIKMVDSTKSISFSDLHIVKNKKATHLLLFESKFSPTNLEFSLIKNIPSWLKISESDEETYINTDTNNPISATKTFGYQNFNFALEENFIKDKISNKNKKYFTCKIGVKQQKSSFILKIILFLVLGFIIYYFYKRLKSK